MNRRWLVAIALCSTAAAIFAATNRSFVPRLATSIQNERAARGLDGDSTPPAAMDPLQMAYLTWAAGEAARHGRLLVEDRHQFANRIERFYPMMLDPLVYVGGWLSIVAPLPFAYNVAQVIVPLLVLVLTFYGLLRALRFGALLSGGLALLAAFVPYRLLNSTMGQHNAASVCLVPSFYWLVSRALVSDHPRRWSASAGAVLLLIGFSEEHVAVSTALFAWPFVIAHVLVFRGASGGTRPTVRSWLARLASDTWPSLPAIGALVAVALIERHFLLHQSIVRHVYDYGVVQQYSVEFNENYYRQTVHYHFVLLPIALAGCAIAVARVVRPRQPDDRFAVVRLAFALVFVSSAFVALGYVPALTRILRVDVYRFLFDHVPLLDMQRYPHRFCYVAYLSGLVMVGSALEAVAERVRDRGRLRLLVDVAMFAALAGGAVDWATRRPATALYDLARDLDAPTDAAIRSSAGTSHIVLMLPATNGSNWSDSRVLLRMIYTNARFFNGYWSYVPTIYWNLVGSFGRLGNDGSLFAVLDPDLRRVDVEYLLVDKSFIREPSLAALRGQPALRLLHEDGRYAYFAITEVRR